MPKKRPLDVRLSEMKERMARLELEQRIRELREKLPRRRRSSGRRH